MIASLPMYDRPETAEANDRFWAAIRRNLQDGPSKLTRSGDLWDQWLSPVLVLSQTCGFPYRAHLHEKVTLVGTPDYALPDCTPGYYYSVFISRLDNPNEHPGEFSSARFAYNDALSQSGWAAPQNFAVENGFRFHNTVATGSHKLSALAVAEGRADIAAIDGLTWELLRRYEGFAQSLHVIARTPPTPALPYITALDRDPAPVAQAIRMAIDSLSPSDRKTLHLHDLISIPAASYLSVPTPEPPPDQTKP